MNPDPDARPPLRRDRFRVSLGTITGEIVHTAQGVYAKFGPGHRESVYVNLLKAALELKGYRVARERIFPVLFHGAAMGRVEADLEVESRVIVEVKRGVRGLDKAAQDQLLSNVTTSGRPVGVLLNFHGERVGSILLFNPFKVRRDRPGGSP